VNVLYVLPDRRCVIYHTIFSDKQWLMIGAEAQHRVSNGFQPA